MATILFEKNDLKMKEVIRSQSDNIKMRVLMFGWEFPPQITGGLGTACYGITKSLAKQNVNILFVVPRTYGNEDKRFATLQNAAEIPSRYTGSSSRKY
jgi:hypothetical protein